VPPLLQHGLGQHAQEQAEHGQGQLLQVLGLQDLDLREPRLLEIKAALEKAKLNPGWGAKPDERVADRAVARLIILVEKRILKKKLLVAK